MPLRFCQAKFGDAFSHANVSFDELYKFAVIRDSVDWVCSLFNYFSRERNNAKSDPAHQFHLGSTHFADFIDNLNSRSPTSKFRNWSQRSVLVDEHGLNLVDLLIPFDQLGQYVRLLADYLDISVYKKADVLVKKNVSHKPRIRPSDLDDDIKKKIYKIYREDQEIYEAAKRLGPNEIYAKIKCKELDESHHKRFMEYMHENHALVYGRSNIAKAKLYHSRKNWNETKRFAKEALQVTQLGSEELSNLSNIFHKLGDRKSVDYIQQQWLDTDSHYSGAHENRGLDFERQGHMSDALSSFERAAELSPGNAAMVAHLGELYLKQGVENQAETAFRMAIKIDNSISRYHLLLAKLLHDQNHVDEAFYEITRAAELGQDSPYFYQFLRELDRKGCLRAADGALLEAITRARNVSENSNFSDVARDWRRRLTGFVRRGVLWFAKS